MILAGIDILVFLVCVVYVASKLRAITEWLVDR